MRFLPVLFAALALPAAAAATPPNLLPTQDVAVNYELAAPGRPTADYLLRYDAAGAAARIDDPAHGTYFLVDLNAGQARLVVPMLHAVVEAPDLATISQEITRIRGARFTSLGPGRYAGLACEKYLIVTSQGDADACLTPDGVALSFKGRDAHGSAAVTATSVTYGPQPPEDFVTPSGFGSVSLPPGALQQLLRQQ